MSLRSSILCAMLIIGLSTPLLLADEDQGATSVQPTEVESLLKQYADSQEKYEDAIAKAKTREDRQQVKLLLQPKPVPDASRFLDWAKLHPTDDRAADVLMLIVVTGGKTEPAARAVNLLAEQHLDLDGDRFFKVAPSVFNAVEADEADRWMRKFADDGSLRQTRAVALFLLGRFKAGLARVAELIKNPQFAEVIKQGNDKEVLERVQNLDVTATNHEAELLFEELISKYPEVEFHGRRSLSWQSRSTLPFQNSRLANLPQKSLDKTSLPPFLLSDYRGKVVVLCFWGTWCAPCMKMVPHHKELISRYKDAPFAFLGIATDQDKEKLDSVIKSEGITWRSWWDGGDTGSPISTTWAIKSWPAIFVLDHHGIIRHKDLYQEELGETVAALLEKVNEKQAN